MVHTNGEVVCLKDNKRYYQDPKIVTDPNGSYTGRPADKDEKPIQDADDL